MAGPDVTETAAHQPVAVVDTSLIRGLDAIGTGAYVVDEEGRILAVNTRARDLLARTAEDLLGHDAHDLLHRDAHGQPLPRSRCRMRQAFHAGRTAQAESKYATGWPLCVRANAGNCERMSSIEIALSFCACIKGGRVEYR
jgi:PAS domain-containing protein